MSTQPRDEAPVPTRRERQRQATYDEIVTVARRLLREGDAISLRAIAQEMGMTPPALYRYIDGFDELVAVVASAIFDEMVATMTAASSRYADDDPGAQLVSAAVAFRQWSLGHPEEFALIFANRATSKSTLRDENHIEGGMRFATFFSEIYEQVWHRYRFSIPDPDELPDGAAAILDAARAEGMLPCDFPGAPIGLSWVFMRAWARLYGTVTLEVFGHLDAAMVEAGAMFMASMEDNGRDLDLGDDYQRLLAVIREELAAPVAAVGRTAT
jgi:AcrR family transcriptional regulator